MIRSLSRTTEGEVRMNIQVSEYSLAYQDSNNLLWVDIFSEPRDISEEILLNTFKFHPLAVADALDEIHIPKVDDWGEYLYLVVRATTSAEGIEQQIETEEVDIFLGKNFIITYHNQSLAAIDRIWERYQKDDRHLRNGATQILYNLIDEIATDYIYLAENIDEAIDTIEDQLFNDPKPILLEKIFSLKRDLLHLRRIIAPQREMVNKLARGDYEIIESDSKIYFRDVYDHFLRLYDILENLRDLTGSALEIYLSVVNNRMNNVMKTLTIITTLFMPISFLAGFFGMNFFEPVGTMEGWTGFFTFRLLIIVVILFPIGMYLWIRKRGWMQ